MNVFRKGPRVSAPQVTQSQQATFKSITIRAATLPRGGDYVTTVLRHLQEIEAFPIGRAFLTELSSKGKRQVIIYGGPNSNQAAGSPMGYTLLRKHHDGGDNAPFAQELGLTLQKAGNKNAAWLTDELHFMALPSWDGGDQLGPFRMPKPALQSKVTDWLAGTALPNNDEMDGLALVLERWLRPGKGVGTRINYDPQKDRAAGVPRPAHAALFHELMHAYYNAMGQQLGREDSANEDNGGRLFELMAVGLGPFSNRRFSENQFRAAWGCPLRARYP